MRKYLFNIYLATGISFLLSAIRDIELIQHTHFSKEFFHLIYVSSLGSSFAINAITLDKFKPKKATFFIYISFSLLVLFIMQLTNFRLSLVYFSSSLIIQFLWILGAIASRSLTLENNVLVGRTREAFASLLVVFLIYIKSDLLFTLIIPVLLTTVIWIFIARLKNIMIFSNISYHKKNFLAFAKVIFLTNLANAVMMLWAINLNNQDVLFWGVNASYLVRVSIYFFQFLFVGSIVLTMHLPKAFKKIDKSFLKLTIAMGVIGLIVSQIAPASSIIFMPVLAIVSHYAAVIYLNYYNNEIKLDAKIRNT